jgi:hypothetical protein
VRNELSLQEFGFWRIEKKIQYHVSLSFYCWFYDTNPKAE